MITSQHCKLRCCNLSLLKYHLNKGALENYASLSHWLESKLKELPLVNCLPFFFGLLFLHFMVFPCFLGYFTWVQIYIPKCHWLIRSWFINVFGVPWQWQQGMGVMPCMACSGQVLGRNTWIHALGSQMVGDLWLGPLSLFCIPFSPKL